jgi:hypothetical protein
MSADEGALKSLVTRFVYIYSVVVDAGLDPFLQLSEGFLPLDSDLAKRKAAHYFLLTAALSDSELTGNARNIQLLMNHLHSAFGDKLYTAIKPEAFESEVGRCEVELGSLDSLGPKKKEIPEVLASVNRFVAKKAHGDLVAHSSSLVRRSLKPEVLVKELSYGIKRMNGPGKAKAWLYLRWMVRKDPDLGVFDFDPKDLMVPLSTPKLRVAVALGLIDKENLALDLNSRSKPASWWSNTAEFDRAQESLTCYARSLFSEDPAKVDFPFFMLGTWLEDFDLTPASLERCLRYFIKKFSVLHKPPIRYLVAVPHYSRGFLVPEMGPFGGFEREVYDFLRKRQIKFDYEFIEFQLPNMGGVTWASPTFTPDFLLSQKTLNGRKILLEPHGVRDGLQGFLDKLSVFREFHGEHFAVALIIPDEFADLVETLDPKRQAYDLFWKHSNYKNELENYRST